MDQTADRAGMEFAMPHAPGATQRQARLALAAQAEARSGLRAQRAERLARLRATADAVPHHGPETGRPQTGEVAGPDTQGPEVAVDPMAEGASFGMMAQSASLETTSQSVPFEATAQSFGTTAEAGSLDAAPFVDAAGAMTAPSCTEMVQDGSLEKSEPAAGESCDAAAEAPADDLPRPDEDVEALEQFLVGLVGALGVEAPPPQPARLAPVVSFGRTAAPLEASGSEVPGTSSRLPDVEGLSRLPGVGPGLVGALVRAGVPDLSALAASEPAALAEALGPIARLLDLGGWVAFAQAATAASAAEAMDRPALNIAG